MKKSLVALLALLVFGMGSQVAQAQKAFDASKFNGIFANCYSDNIGGQACESIVIKVADDGTVTGSYYNDSGREQKFHGNVKGSSLVTYYDDDNYDFATMIMYDDDTVKMDTFTGTFKRTDRLYLPDNAPVERTDSIVIPDDAVNGIPFM